MKHKIGILVLTAVLISTGSALSQVPAYEVNIGQTPVSFAIDFNDEFSVHGNFKRFDGFISENLDEPDTGIVFAEVRDPQFPDTTFVSTEVIQISPNHMKVKGVLRRVHVDHESEQSIIVDLKLDNVEGKTREGEGIKFTATANIGIGRNETIQIVIEGKGKVFD
ncbi:MAG: hypothetical protein COW12_01950 [Candidatus Omnitrophica bacterium CG12_big_fil_rev_8_21_14_0_65_45_16]|nr:MAG: hypothetical protein COW12_01950 [Candidatus Omnitrophica bacterium CG12_big_fil_rev_8_21_14_0_65_45_16]